MRALWRAARGDLRGRRLQTALFALVTALAAAGITAGLSQQSSAADRWDAAFARANGAHVALIGDAGALRRISRDAEVTQSAGPIRRAGATLLRGARKIEDDVDVRAAGARRPAVGTPLLFDGRWLSGRPGEIVVERSFALDTGIVPGDRVRLQGERGSVAGTVVGTALDVVDCFYPQCDSQTAWTAPAAVDRLSPASGPGAWMLLARLAHPDAVETFEARVQAAYGTGLVDKEDWKDTRGDALVVNQFFGAFMAAFGVFLLVAAGLVILSTASARVLARYRELGILKAVGFTPRALAVLVLGESLLIAALGAVVGVAAGGLLAPSLQLQMAKVLERGRPTFPVAVLAGATAAVLLIVAAATLLPALRAGRVPASRAIARGAGAAGGRSSRLAGLAVRLRLGAPAMVGLKDAGARPLRTWLNIATLAVTVIAIVGTLALDRTVGAIADDPALAGDPQALTVARRSAPPSAVERALARQRGVASWFGVTERQVARGEETFQIRALSGDLGRTGYVIRDGRMATRPGELVIGYGLQHALGIRIGDRVSLAVSGGRLEERVVGRYAESEDSGRRAMLTLADLRAVEPAATPDAYYVRVADGAAPASVAGALTAAVPGVVAEVEEADTDAFDAFRIAFTVVSLLVLVIGLVNLTGSTALGVHERIRDIGVLKALGFTPRQVAVSTAVGTAATALAAVAIGIPLGVLAARFMHSTVGRTGGMGPELGADPATAGVAIAALVVVLLAAGTGALVARRVARAPVAEVLRAE